MFLKEHGLEEHVMAPPPETKTNEWISHDSMIHRLMTEAMKDGIVEQVYKYGDAYSIWNYLKEMFERKENVHHAYTVMKLLYRIQRGNKFVPAYFGELKKLESELLTIFPITSDVMEIRRNHEKMMLMTFLEGLGPEFDCIRPQILGGPDVKSLSNTYRAVLNTFLSTLTDGEQASLSKVMQEKSALAALETSPAGHGRGVAVRGREVGVRGRAFGGRGAEIASVPIVRWWVMLGIIATDYILSFDHLVLQELQLLPTLLL